MSREVSNLYFNWMCGLVYDYDYSVASSYDLLLSKLYDTEFIYSIEMDSNRVADGIDLRSRFSRNNGGRILRELPDDSCSILEMMVALAIRCEENIMDDPEYGDRTGVWFWNMITSLGLAGQCDSRYDENYVNNIIETFLKREYYPNGEGSLFTVERCKRDLRTVEIWTQMMWYLDDHIW